MKQDGVPQDRTEVRAYADMRYVGQSYELTVDLRRSDPDPIASVVEAFHDVHIAHYGHANRMAPVEFVNLRTVHVFALTRPQVKRSRAVLDMRSKTRAAFFSSLGGFVDTKIVDRNALAEGVPVDGPAIIEQPDTTLVVYPGQRARLQEDGNILVEVEANAARVA
jgi:N-methylhydantoinase A